jgi:membrane-anchored protein YejM (alkaline phosphatase superfamily)
MTRKVQTIRIGFYYYILSTIVLAIFFLFNLNSAPQLSFMDIGGWIFYIIAGLAHGAILTFIPFALLFLIPVWLGCPKKISLILLCIGFVLLHTFYHIDGLVFDLYRFHINGIVLNMVFGPGSSEIFDFSLSLYLKVIVMIICIAAINVLLLWLANFITKKKQPHRLYMPAVYIWIVMMLFTNGFHIYGAAAQKTSIIESASYIPYFFPLQANKLLSKLGIVSREKFVQMDFAHNNLSVIDYPKHPIVADTLRKGEPLNIIILAIDSWNKRTLTQECMPNTYAFSQSCIDYENHLSSSNGTRGSIFGMFFSVSSYYWKDFDLASVHPVLIHELIKQGYNVQAYPSASLLNPPFAKNIFREIPNLNIKAKGRNVYENDCDITNHFLRDLNKYNGKRPFFSFLFYNLAHNMELSKDKLYHFQPSWTFADYTKLNNDMNPTPFFNFYRNCVCEIDSLTGKIYAALKEKGLLKNTVVIITGDHSQEFNENHKNYWGHGSNYTKAQISIPFLFYYPGCKPHKVTYRTTHYDVAPTLMHQVLGVKNKISDYSMGRYLDDPSPRNWHIVGDNLHYAFIVDQDRIVGKMSSGGMYITDAHLNPLDNYKPKAKELSEAIKKLNSFYKNED